MIDLGLIDWDWNVIVFLVCVFLPCCPIAPVFRYDGSVADEKFGHFGE